MAQSEILIYNVLIADTSVFGLTSNRVYPALLPQAAAFPAITYQRVAGSRIYSFNGYSCLQNNIMQIDCWATSYGQMKNLYYASKEAMENAGTFKALLTLRPDDNYDDDVEIFRASMDFSVWHS
jgi:hypothetical protein